MNELTATERQLPETLPELSEFVLIGRAKLKAVRDAIRAIDRIGVAKEVYQQKLHEAQAIAETVLDAEVKIGELTAKIKNGAGRPKEIIDSTVENKTTKSEALKEIGIPQHTAERFERLASHPDIVEQAKADARDNDRIVTRQDALEKIKEATGANKSKAQREKERVEAIKERVWQREKEMQDSPVVDFQAVKENESDKAYIRNSENYENWKEFEALCRSVERFADKGEEVLADTFAMAGLWGNKERNSFQQADLKHYLECLTKATDTIKSAIMEVLDE